MSGGAVVAHLADLRYDPGRGRISTWLIAVARNRALNMSGEPRLRGAGRGLRRAVDAAPGPAEVCERHSTRARVRGVLTELSAQVSALNFQVFHLRFIEGRTGAEVADALGLTPEQVRFRLHRTKRKFRDLFERPVALGLSRREGRWAGDDREN